MKYYVRFGLWPENERSGIGSVYRKIYGGPAYEKGVSVYPAVFDEDKGRWAIIEEGGTSTFYPTLQELISDAEDGDREIFLVTGDEWPETGSDGEPLLRNLRLIKTIGVSEIYNAEVYSRLDILDQEVPPEIEAKPVAALLKTPGEAPKLIELEPKLEAIHEALGTRDIAWQALGEDILMFTHEMPFGLEPNIAIPDTWSPHVHSTSHTMLYGSVLFARLHRPKDLDFKQYPWPWGQEWQREFDEEEEWPAQLEFIGLTSEQVVHLDAKLGEWVLKKRELLHQPKLLMPGYTHFTVIGGKPWNVVYSLEPCEACGALTKAPNSIQVFVPRRRLLFFGLKELPEIPDELIWSDEFGGATCGCQ